MRPFILHRDPGHDGWIEELEIIEKYFPFCSNSRLDIKSNDLVIGRYSVRPFYEEQERDINKIGAKLINSYHQHQYIANLSNWYYDLQEHTPKTWSRAEDVPMNELGSFVLKGETNSKKNLWNTHMFAQTRKDVINVLCELQDDTLIGTQDIFIRKYIPLISYGNLLTGCPVSKEFRFFICYKQIVSSGFYWSSALDIVEEAIGNIRYLIY